MRALGPASDIYSLGVLTYKALTGHVPFTANSDHEYHLHHLFTKVPPLGGEFSPELDRVIQRALAKAPESRHHSAPDLASALRSALRATERELLRSSAQHWEDQARAPGLLWGRDVLANVERWTRRAPSGALSELECSFLATSQRRARRATWLRRFAGVLAAAIALGGLYYHAAMTRRVAEATITQVEQGRSALLHGEPDALLHLAEAYRQGDHSPGTAFMLARALQPRLTEQARFASSFGRMWSAVFSPDGRQIVTTDDRGAQVWDAQTYRPLFSLPHSGEVYHAVYSADGARLVTVSQPAIRIWDSHGALVHELRQERSRDKPANYRLAAISSDGTLVAAIDFDGSGVDVWDAITGAPVAELRNEPAEYFGLAFSSDGRWLATSGGNDVRVFDARTWAPATTIRGPHVRRLAFDPTGPRLATGTAKGDVAIWAVPNNERIRHLREIGEPVDAVAFSPDGQLVAAASRDGAVQIWRVDSGELESQFNPRHRKLLAVEFDRTSKLILAAGSDGTVVVADVAPGMPITVLEGPQNVLRSAHFDPSARRVVGGSWDGTARVWDATSPYRRWTSPPIGDDCGLVTGAEPDRRFIAVGCRDLPTRVWDTSRDQLLAELPSVSHVEGDFISAFPAVSAAGERAAIARGNTVEIYELPGGRLLRTIAHGAPVNVVAFAGSGRDLVSGAVDGSLRLTHDNGAQLVLPDASGGIDAAAILADGRLIAADAQRRLRVYDRDGMVLADLELPMRVMSLRLDGTRLVTLPLYTARVTPPVLVDLERYKVIAQLEGHVGWAFAARWVGGDILTAGGDGTARLWNGSTGQLRQIYRGGSRFLGDATLSPDGQLVIGGDADGVLRFWDRASGNLLWTLQAHKSHVIGIHLEGGDIVTRGFTGEVSRWTLPSPERVIEACLDRDRCALAPK
jgi:WD40 repeat protein